MPTHCLRGVDEQIQYGGPDQLIVSRCRYVLAFDDDLDGLGAGIAADDRDGIGDQRSQFDLAETRRAASRRASGR